MNQLQTKKPFWYAMAGAGCAALLGGLGVLIFRLISGGFSLLPTLLLVSVAAGGVFLIFLSVSFLQSWKKPSASTALSAVILLVCGVLFLLAFDKANQQEALPQSTVQTGVFYEKATVISIEHEEYQGQQDVEDVPVGSQEVLVELTGGNHKGERYLLTNNLSYLYGTVLSVGDDVTVTFSLTDGQVDGIMVQDYDRTLPILLVVGLFLLITLLVGGRIGAKSLLGLILTIVCVFFVLIPLLLGGWPTLPTILAMCAFVTVVEFVILGGLNRKTLCAILGTVSGVVFAALFGQLACGLLRVNGFQMYVVEPEIEALLQIKQTQDPLASLQIGDLLVGGILIAALGAVNDVAMSISSAMNELISVNPQLSRRELFKSGMNIGRDMVGTMTNTLILALVGSSLVLMIYLSSLTPSFQQLMSTAFFSVEMVQAIASSVGVILAVPLSVVIGMLLFGTKRGKAKQKKTQR